MKKLLLIATLLTNSILALGNYLETPEYSYLKPFLKEEQQITFNKLMKEADSNIERLAGKINNTKDTKERKILENKKELAINEKKKLVEKLNINILKYPERYTESAIQLKEEIQNLILTHNEVK